VRKAALFEKKPKVIGKIAAGGTLQTFGWLMPKDPDKE
jgi:hypothetical protein